MMQQYLLGAFMANLVNVQEPSLGSGPTYEELHAFHRIEDPGAQGPTAHAYEMTVKRL
jgi:hypothetical protein